MLRSISGSMAQAPQVCTNNTSNREASTAPAVVGTIWPTPVWIAVPSPQANRCHSPVRYVSACPESVWTQQYTYPSVLVSQVYLVQYPSQPGQSPTTQATDKPFRVAAGSEKIEVEYRMGRNLLGQIEVGSGSLKDPKQEVTLELNCVAIGPSVIDVEVCIELPNNAGPLRITTITVAGSSGKYVIDSAGLQRVRVGSSTR